MVRLGLGLILAGTVTAGTADGWSALDAIPALRRLSLNLATYGPVGMLLTGGWQQPNNQPP